MEEFKELFAEAIKPYEERMTQLEENDKVQKAEITTLKLAISSLNQLVEELQKAGPSTSSRTTASRTGISRPQTAAGRRTTGTDDSASSSRLTASRTRPAEEKKVSTRPTTASSRIGSGSTVKRAGSGVSSTPTRSKTEDLAAEGAVEADFGRSSAWVFPPTDFTAPEDAKKKPEDTIVLDWVQGYNGRACRRNLFWIDENRVVFTIAGTAVVMDVSGETYTQKFFTGHNEDITALALHRESGFCATGQLDPKGAETPYICVWNVNNLEEEPLKLYKHDRSVLALAFSPDGEFLLSIGGDNDHTMCLWNLSECRTAKQIKPLIAQSCEKSNIHGAEFDSTSTAEKSKWVTYGEKTIKFWTFENGKCDGKKGTLGSTGDMPKHYYGANFDKAGNCYVATDIGVVYIFPAGGNAAKSKIKYPETVALSLRVFQAEGEETESLLTAGYDGKFVTWDLEGNQKEVHDIASSEIIESLPEGTLFKPKSVDVLGNQVIFGTLSNVIIKSNLAAESSMVLSGHSNEFWGLWTHPTDPNLYISCGTDKNLRVWDVRNRGSKSLVRGITMDQKARTCTISPDGKHIAVGLVEGAFKIYDFETLKPIKEEKVNEKTKETINQVRYSADGNWLAMAISTKIFLYKASEGYKKIRVLSGNTGHVTHCCFNKESTYLMSNSNDYQILVWDVNTGDRLTKLSQTRDEEWSDYSFVNAWGSIGVWDPDYDGTDVNAACVSKDKQLLAIGDDFGKVKVFKFPSCVPEAESIELIGHSAHVSNVGFTADDQYLISAGGNDTGIFVWRREQEP